MNGLNGKLLISRSTQWANYQIRNVRNLSVYVVNQYADWQSVIKNTAMRFLYTGIPDGNRKTVNTIIPILLIFMIHLSSDRRFPLRPIIALQAYRIQHFIISLPPPAEYRRTRIFPYARRKSIWPVKNGSTRANSYNSTAQGTNGLSDKLKRLCTAA